MSDRPENPVDSDQSDSVNDDWSSDDAASRFEGATGLLFEQAMAQTRMAVCLTDPKQADNPIVFCNRAFERLTGYRQHEIIGRNCRFLQGPKTDQHQVTKIRDAIRTEEVAVVEILNYRKNGEQFWNALHLGPIMTNPQVRNISSAASGTSPTSTSRVPRSAMPRRLPARSPTG